MHKRIQTLILSITLSFSCFASTSEFEKCYKNPMFGYFYRQQNYTIENKQEDIILKNLVKDNVKSLLDHFSVGNPLSISEEQQIAEIKNSCPSFSAVFFDEREYINEEEFNILNHCREKQSQDRLSNLKCKTNKAIRKSFIQKDQLTNDLKEAIENFERKKSKGVFLSKPHQWSKASRMPTKRFNTKLLTALAMGVTNRFMMTPNDTQLRQWVKDQAFFKYHT